MANVTVTFRNPVTGDTRPDSTVQDDMTVREVTESLQRQQFVPPPKPGQHYVLEIKGKTELASDEATLASGGIANGDIINVVLAQRGGHRGTP
jgi:uncharacterized ubiquitin-like protein YukD